MEMYSYANPWSQDLSVLTLLKSRTYLQRDTYLPPYSNCLKNKYLLSKIFNTNINFVSLIRWFVNYSKTITPTRQIMGSPFLWAFCLPPLFTRDVIRPSAEFGFWFQYTLRWCLIKKYMCEVSTESILDAHP